MEETGGCLRLLCSSVYPVSLLARCSMMSGLSWLRCHVNQAVLRRTTYSVSMLRDRLDRTTSIDGRLRAAFQEGSQERGSELVIDRKRRRVPISRGSGSLSGFKEQESSPWSK